MIIGFEESLRVMMEQQEFDLLRDRTSPLNRFRSRRIKGVVFSDTYNNPFFPIKNPLLKIDKSDMNLIKIRREFRLIYDAPKISFLPWHFFIEFIHDQYFIFNTRPIDMKFPLVNTEVENVEDKDKETQSFLRRNLFDISELIHVVICGDTNSDIYTRNAYETIGPYCITPILRLNNLPLALYQRVFPLGIGDKFDLALLDTYLHREA